MVRRLFLWAVWFVIARLEAKLESYRTGLAAAQLPDLRHVAERLAALWG